MYHLQYVHMQPSAKTVLCPLRHVALPPVNEPCRGSLRANLMEYINLGRHQTGNKAVFMRRSRVLNASNRALCGGLTQRTLPGYRYRMKLTTRRGKPGAAAQMEVSNCKSDEDNLHTEKAKIHVRASMSIPKTK